MATRLLKTVIALAVFSLTIDAAPNPQVGVPGTGVGTGTQTGAGGEYNLLYSA